jgi:large subunit ribosomal protein L3
MPLAVSAEGEAVKAGDTLKLDQMLSVGDVVKVQGYTKGRGFAGAMKRHGFKGSQKTHGQSDRQRAVGSIGSGTTPGRVLKGKRMPGHFGDEQQTVQGLTVLHIDLVNQEVWLSGPIPGAATSTLSIRRTGASKTVDLDLSASGIHPAEAETTEAVPSDTLETNPEVVVTSEQA